MSFDGNDFVTFGRVSAVSTHTIEVWIKPGSASGSQIIAGHVAGPELACSQGMALWVSGGELGYGVDRSGCGSGSSLLTGSVQVGVWTHLAGSFDGSTMRVYRNGNLVGQMSGVPFNASTWMTAGAVTFFNGQQSFYSGQIDELRIWSSVRSAVQIHETMNTTLTGLESGLVGYWKMDEGSGQEVKDSTKSGITGILGTSSQVQSSDPSWVVSTAPIRETGSKIPSITSFTPKSAVAGAPGFDLVINGANFLLDSQVRWNNSALFTTFLGSKQLRASVPASLLLSGGTSTLTVVNPPPGGGLSGPTGFPVTSPAALVNALNPVEVLTGNPAFTLIVYGSSFLPGASVRWNGSNRTTTFVSSTELVALIPAADVASPSSASVTVVNPGGSPSNATALPVVTLAPGAPLVTSLSPSMITAGGPDFFLTVNGTGFQTGASVRWNGAPRETTFVSSTRLTALILALDIAKGSTFGVTVVNPASGAPNQQHLDSVTSNASTASVANPFPILLGFSPDSSSAGSSPMPLTSTGIAFVPSTKVLWNGSDRNTTYVKSSELQALIAAADVASEGTAVVTVSSPGPGGGSSSKSFTILPSTASLTRLYFPRLFSSSTDPNPQYRETTAIALANFDASASNVTLRALDRQGTAISGENLINPVSLVLDREQVPATASQLFGSGLADRTSLGWLKCESPARKLLGFFLAFSDDLSFLDGADVSSSTLSSFIFPEIEDLGFTQLHAANPDTAAATLAFELHKSDGTLRAPAVTRIVNPNGALAEFFTDLFPGITATASDYLRVSSSGGVVPYQFLGKRGQYVHGVNGQDTAKGGKILYSPQYVLQTSVWRSALSVVNLEDSAGSVTLRLIGEAGTQLGEPRTMNITPRGKLYITDPGFFLDAGDQLIQGYVEITSNGPRLGGSVVFGDPGRNRFSSALPLVSTLVREAVFGQVASNDTWFTGIALVNPNPSAANATIDVFDRKGTRLQTKTEVIPAMGRRSRLLTQYFEDLKGQDLTSGYLVITIDREVATFALFGKNDLSALSAVPPQVVP